MTAGLRDDHPFATLTRVRDVDTERAPKALSPTQQDALLKAASHGRHAARTMVIVGLLLHTGLRVAELCALTWGDLVMGERSGQLRVRAGKGGVARGRFRSMSRCGEISGAGWWPGPPLPTMKHPMRGSGGRLPMPCC